MPDESLTSHPAHALTNLLRRGKCSPLQATTAYLDRIQALNPKLQALISVDEERAKNRASALLRADAERLPLYGVPVIVKANICTEGFEANCGSNILSGFHPPYHATVVERLERAGAVVLGMANMDEFAFGSSCETSCKGPTRNPWDLDRIPGGSSGGSAAAIAADLGAAALGSDTGGSIRQPAAMCSVVGLKPTYGRVSRYGLIAFASSLDQIGPLTKDVEDSALFMEVIAGLDSHDSTSADVKVPTYRAALRRPIGGMTVGVPKEYFIGGLDPEVERAMKQALAALKGLGVQFKDVSLPHTEYAVPTYYIAATAEASSNLARFDGVRYGRRVPSGNLQEMFENTRGEGFGAEAKRRIILGTYVLSRGYYDAYYAKALKVRTLIRQDFEKVFETCRAIVTPTAPTPAFRLGEKLDDPLSMYLSDIFTISVNLAGVPALSLPCGFTQAGLPIGMQLIAPAFGEETLFHLGSAYEQATDWHLRKPAAVAS
ncbi:MAG: Asp-tRNA(Asn)/Glu-tRNA(Gln) amidotransferase subunit GatA [Candidatus Omnitrophica bacterium]|nr:Asp-tRNA(Asn)/Glu-tRNA(Gln) amidotransferase subunit GatA [Candidatus Omnitrophota bacterium]